MRDSRIPHSKGGISIEDKDSLREMVNKLSRRGPDANGTWFDDHMALVILACQ